MKKSQLRKLIRESIQEGFRDPEDNYGFPEKPEYFDAFLYFQDLAEKSEGEIPLTISNFAQFLDKHTDGIPDSLLKVINVDTSFSGLVPGDPNWPGEDDRDNFPHPRDLKEKRGRS
mgnify:CR=1 FL=1|tara:strand:+ start:499 stop:846 length:348 start_codon:yes stop_codon:yes gene_type:complete